MNLSNYACDIPAVFKIDKINYLFEIKYWPNVPSSALIHRLFNLTAEMRAAYESQSQRNCKCILMIVTVDEMKVTMENIAIDI